MSTKVLAISIIVLDLIMAGGVYLATQPHLYQVQVNSTILRGTDAYLLIQTAINKGDNIHLFNDTYIISHALQFNRSRITFIGSNGPWLEDKVHQCVTTLKFVGSFGTVINVSADHVIISSICINLDDWRFVH